MAFLQKLWKHIKVIWSALEPASFSIIVLLAGFFYLAMVPQGTDAVLSVSDFGFIKLFLFVLFSTLWAVQIWYWAKIVYILRQQDPGEGKEYPLWIQKEMPRVLGLSAFLVIAISMFAMQPFAHNFVLVYMGILSLSLAVAFYLFTRYRKRLFRLDALEQELERNVKRGQRIGFGDFPASTRTALIAFTLLSVIPFLFIIADPHTFTYKGGVTLIILCFSMWVPIGSWILYLSYHWKLPVFTLLIGLSIVFSLFNDNHYVRVLHETPQQSTLGERVDAFLTRYPLAEPGTRIETNVTGETQPLYIVTAAGGGIRAAYWTAVILGALQDKDPQFANQLFAISSVSGGSLGAGVFAGLVKAQKEGRHVSLFKDAGEVLKADFLSPTVGMMLTGDILQRVIPVPWPKLSRALALEQSFEKAWFKAIGSDQFNQPLKNLWQGKEGGTIPSLFLNGTRVESGLRIITGNIRIDDHFIDASNFYELSTHQQEIRLSTAVDNSCRFPYVSPAGTLADETHIVDGGYFDNSGASTAIEVMMAIMDHLKKTPRRVRLVAIVITNDPNTKEVKPLVWLSGLLAPAATLLNVWSSHDGYYINQFERLVSNVGGTFVHFVPQKTKLSLPLGWSLSEPVRKDLDKQAQAVTQIPWPPK